MKRALLLGVLFVAVAFQTAMAEPPQTISYQGILREDTGGVVPDGVYEITFRLYDAPTGGTVLWEEVDSLAVTNGVFNVILGKLIPINLPFDQPYYMGVQVGEDPEAAPRVELTAAPYVFRAMVADSLTGMDQWDDGDWVIDVYTGNIYYLDGNVGIGTETPMCPLDVYGSLCLGGLPDCSRT